jgi:hypothetical protein
MLLSKLSPGATKPLMRPMEILHTGPRSATDGGSSSLSLVLHPERASV